MFKKTVTVTNQVGLFAKPATYFIRKANEFKSSIRIEKDNHNVNAKSLLSVLSLSIQHGDDMVLVAEGVDEEAAVNELAELINSNLD
ncbi:MAG: HPr family phosphocarrier protein [Clostridia bacterium]|nr:HPr family phosphocarrier protein [Clostridia bacterium]